jgi:hypothetical protein
MHFCQCTSTCIGKSRFIAVGGEAEITLSAVIIGERYVLREYYKQTAS